MNIIEMKGVTKDYPLGKTKVHALKGIDLSIEKGDFLSIVGPSGSGKTTLLNIIGCIDNASQGSFKLNDQEIFSSYKFSDSEYKDNISQLKKNTPMKTHDLIISRQDENNAHYDIVIALKDKEITDLRLFKIGFIFQTFNLIPVLNVLENVEFPLLLMKKYNKKEVRDKAAHYIEEVGIKDYMHHRPAELSGGQRQRVAIARALVTQPDIILADEPTANLDSETGNLILKLMRDMNEIQNTTFIFSTHDPEVLKYAKKVIKIRDGKLTKE